MHLFGGTRSKGITLCTVLYIWKKFGLSCDPCYCGYDNTYLIPILFWYQKDVNKSLHYASFNLFFIFIYFVFYFYSLCIQKFLALLQCFWVAHPIPVTSLLKHEIAIYHWFVYPGNASLMAGIQLFKSRTGPVYYGWCWHADVIMLKVFITIIGL